MKKDICHKFQCWLLLLFILFSYPVKCSSIVCHCLSIIWQPRVMWSTVMLLTAWRNCLLSRVLEEESRMWPAHLLNEKLFCGLREPKLPCGKKIKSSSRFNLQAKQQLCMPITLWVLFLVTLYLTTWKSLCNNLWRTSAHQESFFSFWTSMQSDKNSTPGKFLGLHLTTVSVVLAVL